MKFIEKYFKLQSIVKTLGLKKIKTKNILTDRRYFTRISVDWQWYPATNGSHAKIKSWKRLKDYKGLNWESALG